MLLLQALETVEKQLEEASAALQAVDAASLEQRSHLLLGPGLEPERRRLLQALEDHQGPWPAELIPRIRQVSAQLALQRDQLARVAAVVDKQLAGVLPPSDNTSTYGNPGRNGATGARIYRSAG